MITEERNNIGRMAAVVHNGRWYVVNVIDQVAGTSTPKRVRIQRDPFKQGTVLMPAQYEFKEWIEDD